MNNNAIADQAIGAVAQTFNDIRAEDLQSMLNQINSSTNLAFSKQDIHFAEALKRIDDIQRFIENPEGILGSQITKHGEIAEQVEVGITNARAALYGLADRATNDPNIVGRTAPTDYLIDGHQVQSKFYNGELNTLKGVYEHLHTYKDINFAHGDGSYYDIPKDQFDNIIKILNEGNLDGRNQRNIDAILRQIHAIEDESGQKFVDIIKAAQTDYKDVQWGKIQNTIDNYRSDISYENHQIIEDINDKSNKNKQNAILEYQPNWGEATKVAAIGAAIKAGMTLAIDVYKKKKEGKDIAEFTEEDWKELGLDTVLNAGKGGVTGYSIYGLTNLANMSAPVASGLVSATFGMTSLVSDYRKDKLTFDEFIDSSEIVCMDAGVATLGSIIGQTIIPIPVVGAVVGSIVSNIVFDLAKDMFNKDEMELLNAYHKRLQAQMKKLDIEVCDYVQNLMIEYQKIGGILRMAFNEELNHDLRFKYSQQLALTYGVKPKEVLMTVQDVNRFFLK